jgi:hypothetical protein
MQRRKPLRRASVQLVLPRLKAGATIAATGTGRQGDSGAQQKAKRARNRSRAAEAESDTRRQHDEVDQ